MDDKQFLNGLHTQEQKHTDLVQGAEHLLRLKQQVGYEQPSQPDLELEKEAWDIEPSDRSDIPKGDYAQPNKEEEGHKGKYPIPDRQHARIAMGFAKMHHDSGAEAAVRAKVEQKYPDMIGGKEKDGGEVNSLDGTNSTSNPALCPNCDKEKTACMCKAAGALKELLQGARAGLKYQSLGAGAAIRGLGIPGARARSAGMLAGTAAPLAAGGAAAYALGKHQGSKEKEAGEMLRQAYKTKCANALIEAAKRVDPALIATTGLGAVAGGLGTYLASRPQKDTGKSKAEEQLEGQVAAQKDAPERGLMSKMHHRNTELEHGYAQAFRQHPGKAALIGALSGGIGGYGLGRLGGAIIRARGGK